MSIEKLTPTTPDLTKQNVQRLAELFPECVTEGPQGTASDGTASDADGPVIDFDLLRQALSNHVVEGPQERYRLDWPGKRQALLTANTPIDKTLRPVRADSVDFDTTRNLFIEGDNLDALKLLQETYLGKVKMIYIDPPYNTGKDFIYKDNFAQSREDYEAASGQRDDTGGRLVANPENSGRFHSDWLSMMYPRLKLARNLLRDDGIIFISIDDGEQANLRGLCDPIFGASNFVANIIWQKKYAASNDSTTLSDVHDFIVCYAKEISQWKPNLFPRSDELNNKYKNPDNDPRGVWYPTNLSVKTYSQANDYDIVSPAGIVFRPPPSRCWVVSKDKLATLIADGRIWFGKDGSSRPYQKTFLTEVQQGVVPETLWLHEDAGHNIGGKSQVRSLFEDDTSLFDTPKPTKLIRRLHQLVRSSESEIVVDFFAGSASTAHAVLEANQMDKRADSFVCVQLASEIENDDSGQTYSNIAQLSRERIRRAGSKILAEMPELKGKLDIGFRTFRIDSGNLLDVAVTPQAATQAALSGMISHIKDDRSDEDLLFGALLNWGVDITLPVAKRELLGRTIWLVDPPASGDTGAALIACFARPMDGKGGIDTELADAIATLAPLRVLFRDDGFASDAAKENVASRLKQRAPDTAVRVL